MEAQSPPSKIYRSFVTNGKPAASVSCGFTFMQLIELEQQSLIYNYIEAGIPVPTYLILPIWRSFPTSVSHQLYPNYLLIMVATALDYNPRSSKDSEPGRCRRTDGKTWRCSKSVVQGQKYCHSHIHRGHLRSRNHVQPPTTTSTTTTAAAATATETCNSDKFSDKSISISL